MDAVSLPHYIVIGTPHTVGNQSVAVGQAGLGIDICQFGDLLADGAGFGLGDELGCLNAIHHKAQFVGVKLRLGDVVAPFAGVVFNGNAEIIVEPDNIIVNGFDGCFNAVLCEELLDGVGVLGMLLGSVMV